MKTDVSVSVEGLSGLGSNGEGITGISITYGYNMIPVAHITLNTPWVQENSPDLFSNPASKKKETKPDKVKIKIKSSTGCLDFEGFFDGMSSTQTPGGMDFTIIIKNKFQMLFDMYPKYIGVYPGSCLSYRFNNNLTIQGDDPETMYKQFGTDAIGMDDLTVGPVEFYINSFKKIVQSQQQKIIAPGKETTPIINILEDQSYKDNLQQLIKELDNIDIDNAKTPDLQCTQCAPYVIDILLYGGDTAWDLLLHAVDDVGCVLVCSNTKLYVIPKSTFLKLDGSRPGDSKQQSSEPNKAYPADYSNFVLNDVSYKNIKYCFVEAQEDKFQPVSVIESIYADYLGQYPKDGNDITPDDGAAGVLVVQAPPYLARNLLGGVLTHNSDTRKNIEGGKAWADTGKGAPPDTPEDAASPMDSAQSKVDQKIGKDANKIKEVLDKYAKARFLQEKYTERTGSFNMQFNPQWVPASTGFLACQSPCLVYNFYVTSVTHHISTTGARSGSASTQVTFNSARWGGNVGSLPSTQSNELYNYDDGKMKGFQKKWLGDNKAKFSQRKT